MIRNNISRQHALSYVVSLTVCMLFLFLMINQNVFEWLGKRFAEPMEFKYRDAFGNSPSKSDDLIMISFDRFSKESMKKNRLSIKDWMEFLTLFEQQNPKSIIFSHNMEYPDGIYDFDPSEFVSLTKTYPVIRPFKRGEAQREGKSVKESSKIDPKFLVPGLNVPKEEGMRWFRSPHEKLVDLFPGYGTADFLAEKGAISIAKIDEFGDSALHYSLFVSGPPKIEGQTIVVNGKNVPHQDFQTSVNFFSHEDYKSHVNSRYLSLSLFDSSNKKHKLALSALENKVILVTRDNNAEQGGFLNSPIGKVTRNHILWSALNSAMSGEWIQSKRIPRAVFFMLVIIGCAVPVVFQSLAAIFLMGIVQIGIIWGGLWYFSAHLTRIEWLSAGLAWGFSSVFTLTLYLYLNEINAKRVRRALTGIMPSEQISKIASNPSMFNDAAREKNITVMFIDIIGFSLVSEHTRPDIAFKSLKETLSGVTKLIHKHGGVVDKTLGDGVLCFFGGGIVADDNDLQGGAQNAVKCALEIQKYTVERILISETRQIPPFPVRVGINTSDVYIGNIGNDERYDFTIIGSGVNFAQRLENACEPFKVLVGAGTLMLLGKELKDKFTRRMINIKHHHELIEAFEIDPFSANAGMVDRADEIMRQFHKITRTEERISLGEELKLELSSEGHKLSVSNFSSNGFAAFSSDFFGKKVKLNLTLKTEDGYLTEMFDSLGINPIHLEVCWGRVIADGKYLHGLRMVSLNNTQKERLFELLKMHLLEKANFKEIS